MKKRFDFIFLILLAGLIWKTFFLYQHNHLNPDGAMIGLMARHILEGQFPIFFYGYGYIGSLKSFIGAGLFTVFGANTKTLLLLPALFYVGFSITTYWWVSLVANRKASQIAMLFTILASQWMTLFSAEIVGGYMDTLFYGNLLFIFLHKFCFGEAQHKWKWSLALGLFSGLALWQFPLSGYYLITIGTALFILRPSNIFSKTLPLFGFSFLIGSAPFWLFNIYHQFNSFGMVKKASLSQFFDHFLSFFNFYVPAILGWGFQADTLLRKGGWILIGVLFFAGLIWLLGQIKWQRKHAQLPLPLLFVITLFLFSRSNYVGDRSPMVALPLLFIFPALIGIFLSYLNQQSKLIFWGFILILIPSYSLQTYASSVGRQQNAHHFEKVTQTILTAIKEAQLDTVYAPYSLAPVLSFKTEEQLIAGNFLEEPVPGYKNRLNASDHPGFIMTKNFAPHFEINLSTLGCTFKKREVENHVLFFDVKQVHSQLKSISPKKWKGPEAAFDRNRITRWTPNVPQKPGQQFELDLGQSHSLAGIELRCIEAHDLPRSLKVEVSNNQKEWKQIALLPFTPTPLYFSGPHPFSDLEHGRLELSFEPTPARFIRFTQMSRSPATYWSVHEVYLYEPTQNAFETDESLEQLIKELNNAGQSPIYTDTWLSEKLRSLPETGLLNLLPYYNPRERLSVLKPEQTTLDRFVDWNKHPLFVIHQSKAPLFESGSYFKNLEWTHKQAGAWKIYQLKEAPQRIWKALSKKNWSATASPKSKRASRAISRPEKRWNTTEPQAKGMEFTLDLNKNETISKVELTTGPSFWEYPRHFKLYASKDQNNWKEIEIKQIGLAFWDGKRLVKSQLKNRILPIEISPTETRYLKIKLTQDFTHSEWSISDINIY